MQCPEQSDFRRDFQGSFQSVIDSDIWVIKIGSAILTDYGRTIDHAFIRRLVTDIALLRQAGKQAILVSSGAIAAGMQQLGWRQKPKALSQQQAAAAVGQMALVRVYEECFAEFGMQTAQILLTHEDAADRRRYLNIKATMNALLEHRILPIVNENDTVSFDEIKFGDNDNLGALVANIIGAGLYVILTDQYGLYDADPREHHQAKRIAFDRADNPALERFIGHSTSNVGSGGMFTKLQAARKAMNSATTTIIMHGRDEQEGLRDLLAGNPVGTVLFAGKEVRAKKQWLAGQVKTKGRVTVDTGAEKVLLHQGRSLLAVGIISVSGQFSRGEIIAVDNADGVEIARGISNYNSEDIIQIKGLVSDKISQVLGYVLEKHVIHRDNLVLV